MLLLLLLLCQLSVQYKLCCCTALTTRGRFNHEALQVTLANVMLLSADPVGADRFAVFKLHNEYKRRLPVCVFQIKPLINALVVKNSLLKFFLFFLSCMFLNTVCGSRFDCK